MDGSGLCRKAVIVGNGPSLNVHVARGDFELLRMVPTIAMNRIDLLYDQTAWRPDWYLFVEQLGPELAHGLWAPYILDGHILPGQELCVVDVRFRRELMEELNRRMMGLTDNVRWVTRTMCPHYGQMDTASVIPTAWHLPEWCAFGGAITAAFHLAITLGYLDIAVIGCDLGLGVGQDHFHPDYHSYPDGTLDKVDATLEHAHRLARTELNWRGGCIVNAGIGGSLDVHERMDFRRWLND